MACVEYMKANGWTPDTSIGTVQSQIYIDGIQCVNSNMPSCSAHCADLTKTQSACFTCLMQSASCPSTECATSQVDCSDPAQAGSDCCKPAPSGSCCPRVDIAVQCGSCLAANGNNQAAWQSCTQPSGLSSKVIIIIVVCCVVALVVIVTVIVVVVKLKNQAKARERLVANLQRSGVDQRIVHNVQQLNYSNIDSSVFKEADVQMALKQASKRVQPVPPPKNVAVAHLASETEGLFAL